MARKKAKRKTRTKSAKVSFKSLILLSILPYVTFFPLIFGWPQLQSLTILAKLYLPLLLIFSFLYVPSWVLYHAIQNKNVKTQLLHAVAGMVSVLGIPLAVSTFTCIISQSCNQPTIQTTQGYFLLAIAANFILITIVELGVRGLRYLKNS
jgi:hypothetical protein